MGGVKEYRKMSVPKGKRRQSRFEAQHCFYKLRTEVTNLMLQDFGFSPEKYKKQIEKYREMHRAADNVDEIVARYEKKCESFVKWFIDKECDTVLEILRNIESEFTQGNSIYPSDTPAQMIEYVQRRCHMNNAIAQCYVLKQEIHYIIRTLPVDINKYKRFAETIDKQIALYKGVRQSDNRFARKNGKAKMSKEAIAVTDSIAELISKINIESE